MTPPGRVGEHHLVWSCLVLSCRCGRRADVGWDLAFEAGVAAGMIVGVQLLLCRTIAPHKMPPIGGSGLRVPIT